MNNPKRTIEIILMPLVVAIVGIIGTYLITAQQQKSALVIKQAEIESVRELAEAERQIKIIEIFNDRLTSANEEDRILGIKMLDTIDPEFAQKLANIVAEAEPEGSRVQKIAIDVVSNAETRGYSFPLVGSFLDNTRAIDKAIELLELFNQNKCTYKPEIYKDPSGWFVVSLGGYLSRDEATKRVAYAKRTQIASDAFIWYSKSMGSNLLR